jgi:hypothetical protein
MLVVEYPIKMIEQGYKHMLISFYKFIFIFTINLIVSIPIYAETVEQKKLNFSIKSQELMNGDIHHYFEIISPRKLTQKYPEVFELDSLSLSQESNVQMVLNKSVMIVNKPVGFFDDKQMLEDKFIAHILGEQKTERLGPDAFKIIIPGEGGYSYRMQSFFDADDISTLPNSKVIRAVTAAKKLDVISQGASTIMFTEKTNYSKYAEGGVSVSSFIPMKENKTLVITYNLYAVNKPFASYNVLKTNFLTETKAQKSLFENYK